MPCAKISLILLGVLTVSVLTQEIPNDSMAFLDQTGFQLGTELQTEYSLRNQGLQTPSTNTNGFQQTHFRQQLQTVPLRTPNMPLRSISTVEPELTGPNEGIGHDSSLRASSGGTNGVSQTSFLHRLQSFALQSNRRSSESLSSIRIVDPELLGPHEGIGHYYPLQIANVFNPTLLGPNEGIGHNYPLHIANVYDPTFLGPDEGIGHNYPLHIANSFIPTLLGENNGIDHKYPLQLQNVFTTIIGVSSRSVSDGSRDKPQSSPFSHFDTIFPFRAPKREIVHSTDGYADYVQPIQKSSDAGWKRRCCSIDWRIHPQPGTWLSGRSRAQN
ncbi:hypothetical protein ACJMK2_034071 [Sinanodonta woodiana]|uniref:Uncharacterized protein n=1 Tax=Sinanodonta woodiana TaxID=1069815 RepID=A0ABD3WQE4_SINWO